MTVYKLESVPDPLFEQNPVLYNALWNARNVEVKVPEVPGIHINMDTRTITVTGDLPTEDILVVEEPRSKMMFTIVKHADATHWDHFFVENPVDGVGLFCSAHATYSGERCGLQEVYTDLALAEADCKKINAFNPSGGYAVCRVTPKDH